MKKYEIDEKKFSELENSIEIPKFQRGLVWSKEKKREFIKTLKEGLPIGVLLLYAKEDNKYLVVDGLQRFTTMKEYSRDYFAYIDSEEISDIDIMDVIMACGHVGQMYDNYTTESKERLREAIRKIIVECIRDARGKNSNLISWNATNRLCNELVEFSNDNGIDIQNTIYNIVEAFSKNASIEDVVIPMIIFKGEESELALIYQKLNQEGVKLSKYDVFAATWVDHTVKVLDEEFIELIIRKYKTAEEESDLDISDFDEAEILTSGELTVFEYAFGIGKALSKACPYLFPKYDEAKVDSIGFVILAELLGLSYGKMGKLAEVIDSLPNLNYKELKDKIVEVCRDIEECLGKNIVSPTLGKASLACHSELQLVSYIVVLFKLKYEISKESGISLRKGKNAEICNLKKYLYKHYLYDILKGTWSGSGDSKLSEISSKADTCQYLLDVDRNSFEQLLIDWLDSSVEKIEQKQVSKVNKLFLNYLLRGRIINSEKGKYDIEHCVPQKVIETYFLNNNIMVPMSSVCNIIYIPMPDNRGKREKTYYQKKDEEPSVYVLDENALEKFIYPRREELRFVESVSGLTKDNYYDFLNKRKVIIKEAMMELLYK